VAALGLGIREERVAVWGGRLELTVQVAGSGPPLLYLHPAAGLHWDPFLDWLADSHTVYAPQAPGTTPGRPEAIAAVDDLWDLVLAYEELVRALGLDRPVAVGESFGGMLGCELAAHFPHLLSRLVVFAPIGLWLEDHPVANWVAAAPEEIPALLFHDPLSDAARTALTLPDDRDDMIAAVAGTAWAIGCTSKFVWPIPDRRLRRRLPRITAKTLVIHGTDDRFVPVSYADDFAGSIRGARKAVIADAAHMAPYEKQGEVLALVDKFIGA